MKSSIRYLFGKTRSFQKQASLGVVVVSIIGLALMLLPQPALAVDLTVTCDDSDCVMAPAPGAALFEEGDVKPGDTYDRTITVTNTGGNDCQLLLETKNEVDPNGFGNVLFTNLNDPGTNYFGTNIGGRATGVKNLTDLFAIGPIDLGTIPAGGGNNYQWLVSIDTSVGNEYQKKRVDFDFDLQFTCGEPEEEPALVITKDNDRKGEVLGVGDVVTYTITVENTGSVPLFDVEVQDAQPTGDYFDYRESSGHLSCTDGPADQALTATGTNPYYWDLEDMTPNELCTLTYELEIISTAIPGTHYNIAFAKGFDEQERVVYSNIVFDPFDVGISGSLSDEFSSETEGEVLGASTVGKILGAATGSKTFWLILAAVLVGLGWGLRLISKRLGQTAIFLIIGTVSLTLASPILAIDTDPPIIKIVQLPTFTQSRDFEISYTALDGGEAGLASVHVEYQKEGGSWQDLGTFSEVSRKISLSGKITEDGKYFFRATACDTNSNCQEDQTETTVKLSQPPPPEDYHKEQLNPTTYKLTWHNPNADNLDWVFIYRSDQSDFTADGSTKIAQVPATRDTDGAYTDTVSDAGKTYYYALREVDKAGNASDLVGDKVVTTTTTTTAPTGETITNEGAVSGQILGAQQETSPAAGGAGETGEGQILGEETPTDETSTAAASPQPEPEITPIPSVAQAWSKLPSLWRWLLGIGGFVLAAAIGLRLWRR